MAAKKTRVTAPDGAGEMIEKNRYEDRLECPIPIQEVEIKAGELAKVIREREEMLERKREANAKFRERIAFFDERLTELAESVEKKVERRNVQVIEYYIPRTGEMRAIRSDTNEIIESRAATAEERQEPLFSEGANPAMKTDRPPAQRKRGRPKKAVLSSEPPF